MTPSHENLEALFEAAAALESEAGRAEFLNRACPDPGLRREVESLLAAHQQPDDIFEQKSVRVEPVVVEGVGSRVGHYKLLQQIGEGGCGVVYLAEQNEPIRRRVALKVIKLGMDTKSVIARFEAERQALALMDHPNIAKVLDAGATGAGRPFFVMELVRGVRITEYCDQQNLSIRERLDLFIKVCHAIQHAHQKGIIHRDIKPSNILVTLHDGVPVPKVIDFGIAKATTHQRLTDRTLFTALEQFVGTPAYMSPEQAEMSGLDIDTRSDIYSLGVLLYELLTGGTPFDAHELLAAGVDGMRRTILEQEPVRPSTRLRQTTLAASTAQPIPRPSALASDLDWIVMKALEKDRTRRYETANGFAADLHRHLNHEPVVARPPSRAYRFQKAWRRNKLAFVAATVVTTALVLGLAVSSWQMVVARQARNSEEVQRLDAQAARRLADAEARKATESQQRSRRLLYDSDIYLAQQELKLNNLGKTRRLLERNRPQPGEEDLRGWEWRYLWQQIRSSALARLTNRPARGTSVSFSPDGTRLAVGWYGGRVELWDVPGRRWERTLVDGEFRQRLGRVSFSPVRNLLAATEGPDDVTLHDLDSGRRTVLWRTPEAGLWDIRDLSFSPDGSRLVIYAGSVESIGDAAWVVDVATSRSMGRYPAPCSNSALHGAGRLSPDNQRLYLARSDASNELHSIRCLDLATGREIWETTRENDYGLTALALSPDGTLLASGSGFGDPTIRLWDTATGLAVRQLAGHSGWVCKLVFSRDGQRLISAASDQSIRFWDTKKWKETRVLRGHTDEVYAVAISETAQLAASAGKDGNLLLWRGDGTAGANSYHPLPDHLRSHEVVSLDRSRVLLLPPAGRPAWIDLQHDSAPVSASGWGASTSVLGFFGTNILCAWDGNSQILVHAWRGTDFVPLGAITTDPGARPTEFAYDPVRQVMAWTDGKSPTSIYLASLAHPGRRTELKSDLPWLTLFRFNDDGRHLAATARHDHSLRAWAVETGQLVISLDERVRAVAFALGGRVLVAAIEQGNDHEIGFFDLSHPGQAPRRVQGKDYTASLAVSPDGRRVASATSGGQIRLYDPALARFIEAVHGQLNGVHAVAFSPDGRRLISTSTAREAVKVWDIDTQQELLTLSGTGSGLVDASWSVDGDVILVGPPWQAWHAPSWSEIEAADAREASESRAR